MHVIGDIALWYLTSIHATASSKDLIAFSGIPSNVLTLCQLVVATLIGGVVVTAMSEDLPDLSKDGLDGKIWKLAAVRARRTPLVP